ncbi:acyl-homoserine-lactone synthase [Pseudomonas sp. NPDC089547]|uniref:acyl-homoserine-lactone synthase n=1 Tax=Pseudomonas sp. NPDC089547 TaxID=3390652 RepID=UPI003CFE5C94
MLISIQQRNEMDSAHLKAMHALRARVFKDRKQWDVSIIDDMEIDGYDALNPYYMLIRDPSHPQVPIGCWRLMPTTGPNMLAHSFSQLLHGQPAPCSERVWELSRFAIDCPDRSACRFSEGTIHAISEVVAFGMARDLCRYVTVTTTGVERLLRRLGVDLSRLGPARQIGVERAVALMIELNEITRRALAARQPS